MNKFLFLLFILASFNIKTSAQIAIGPLLSVEWNLYQRPNNHSFALLSGGKNSAGQVLNVLPSTRLGVTVNFNNSDVYFLLEGGVNYMPFSIDLEERKGQGALSFPIVFSVLTDLAAQGIMLSVGGGLQFSRMEYNLVEPKYQGIDNPFFHTYVLELGLGSGSVTNNEIMLHYLFFARAGLGKQQSMSLDFGVKIQLGLLF